MAQIDEKQYRALKSEVDTARDEASRAQGALDNLMARLKDEFGCKTLKEAREKLTELESQRDEAVEDFEAALNKYRKDWKQEGSEE